MNSQINYQEIQFEMMETESHKIGYLDNRNSILKGVTC